METIKSVLGYGTKAEEGQEPVSGQQGTGNAVEPYDAGNSEDTTLGGKAPQVTDATSTSTPAADTARPEIPTPKPSEQFPMATETRAADATASSGKPLETSPADDLSPSVTTGASSTAVPTSTSAVNEPSTAAPASKTPAVGETSTPESSADQPMKTGGIGSSGWFKTALPFVGNKNKTAAEEESASNVPATATSESNPIESSTTAGASKVEEDPSTLPPNHLPTQVPEGVSTDLAPPQTPAAAETLAATTTTDPTTETTASDPTPATISAVPSSSETKSDAPAASELPGTKAPTHTSRFAEDDPDLHRGNNPSSIPTAGGKTLGVAAVEERKDAGLPADPGPNLPETAIGNPDATSAAKVQDHTSSGEKESVTSGSSSVGKDTGSSSVEKDSAETPEKEGKHKHHLLQKIKDKIKH